MPSSPSPFAPERTGAGEASSSSTVLYLSDDDGDGGGVRGSSPPKRTTISTGDTVFCKRSIPRLGIYENSSYEVTSIYVQYFDDETQRIVKLPLESLDEVYEDNGVSAAAARRGGGGGGGKNAPSLYLTLYSPKHHAGGRGTGDVVVSPEDAGLTSVRDELGNAAWLAVPGFFWVYVALSFYSTYHDRTGGSFVDAFWGR